MKTDAIIFAVFLATSLSGCAAASLEEKTACAAFGEGLIPNPKQPCPWGEWKWTVKKEKDGSLTDECKAPSSYPDICKFDNAERIARFPERCTVQV